MPTQTRGASPAFGLPNLKQAPLLPEFYLEPHWQGSRELKTSAFLVEAEEQAELTGGAAVLAMLETAPPASISISVCLAEWSPPFPWLQLAGTEVHKPLCLGKQGKDTGIEKK